MDFDSNENLDFTLNEIAGNVIKRKRLSKGYSLDDVVNKLNKIITKQSLYRYENNEARMKNDIFKSICLALDENPSEVWNEINDMFLNSLSFDNGEIIDKELNTVQIPVLGTIKAGIPIEAQEEILEYIEIPRKWVLGGKKFYGLRISGDSMFPKYQEGDTVIFEQSNDKEQYNNKDCAVMVNGDDATFKKVLLSDSGITLVPYNTAKYEMMMYSNKDIANLPIRIVGIAREKRTKL